MGHLDPPSSFAEFPDESGDWPWAPNEIDAAGDWDGKALLARYAAIACRAHDLLATSLPDDLDAPDEVVRLLEDAVYRLGLYVSAMPGARAAPAAR